MPEETDWSLATWEGSRKRQHQEFRRLSLREKLKVIEELDRVARVMVESQAVEEGSTGATRERGPESRPS